MKKLMENMAVVLVVALFGLVIVLVVQYNMIEEKPASLPSLANEEEKPSKEARKKAYLESLESYGEDKDVKVDPTKESSKNTVKVRAEETKSELETVLQTDEKKAYVENLENYSKKKESTSGESLEDVAPKATQNGDTIGDELESIVGE